jgi:DNA invertase Pin-like site-specific DNA recombinase
VLEYSNRNYTIDERDQFEGFIQGLKSGDIIIVDEIWMLSEKMDEIVKVINCMLSRGITLYIASSNSTINIDSLASEIFPLLNTIREEQQKRENHVGRPRGSRSKSKFDRYQTEIISLLREGMSVSAISRELRVSRSSLKDYIESRGIKEMIKGSWVEISSTKEDSLTNDKILICPFELESKQKEGEIDANSNRQ